MLSLLTYGATFGVAEAVNTRHEFESARNSFQLNAIDSGTEHPPEHQAKHQIEHQTEHEQDATKGSVVGWLRRVIQRRA